MNIFNLGRYVIIILVFAVCVYSSQTQSDANSQKVNKTIIYCISPFSNNTGNEQYNALAESIVDILTATLGEHTNMKIVERQRFLDVLKEQKLSLAGLTDPATAVKVGKLLKADRILIGGITKPQNDLIINLHIYEIQTARLVTSAQSQGKSDDTVQAINGLINQLSKGLNVELKQIDDNDVDKNVQASLHFIRGLNFYFSGNFDPAIIEFMKSLNLDPNSDKTCYWLAVCFMQTGEYEHALVDLENLLGKFPNSSFTKDVQQKIIVCKNHINGH